MELPETFQPIKIKLCNIGWNIRKQTYSEFLILSLHK